jgi:hypothetical protein
MPGRELIPRWAVAVVCALALVAGCGRNEGVRHGAADSAEAAGHPRNPVFESWVMDEDSFGPITTDMTKDEIVATGAFRVAPTACSAGRLDWYSQDYAREADAYGDGKADWVRTGSGLPSISLGPAGRPQLIDPGERTRLDSGIRRGDSLERLRTAYPGRLTRDEEMERGALGAVEDTIAVGGTQSHLVFYLFKGKIMSFYLERGALRDGLFSASMRGIGC